MENDWKAKVSRSVKESPFVRILLLGFLVLLLHIPTGMIQGVIGERQATRREAVEEVTGKWGRSQSIIGPSIVIPFMKRWTEQIKPGETQNRSEIRYAVFLPENLQYSGKIDSEVRYRGIFKIPVYTMNLSATGQFAKPDLSQWQIPAKDILWDRAYLCVGISDVRAISNQAVLTWNNEKLEFIPGSGEAGTKNAGIHARLTDRLRQDNIAFSYTLNLRGSECALFAPFGKETRVDLESNWTDPSFQGSWLPSQRTVSPQGFKASWSIPFLGRSYPQKWTSTDGIENSIPRSLFGVSFLTPVDHYRMSERSIKYATLFLALTFATLWLFEILVNTRIHLVQYLLVGAGICLFYLLEMSLAEHIGFNAAYMVASFAIVALIFTYCIAVLQSGSRATIVGVVVIALYGYLYVLLRDQDYALVIGAIGLFIVLALIMYMTRKVDWYKTSA